MATLPLLFLRFFPALPLLFSDNLSTDVGRNSQRLSLDGVGPRLSECL